MKMRTRHLPILFAFVGASLAVLLTQPIYGQKSFYVAASAEGNYWMVNPKPWFTRQLTLSNGNRRLPKDDHDESLPTLPGYYHRKIELSPSTRYPFAAVRIQKGTATFTTKTVKGLRFVFRGRWATEYLESAMIENVPFLKGILLTYRRGKLVKKENVKFSHAVNA